MNYVIIEMQTINGSTAVVPPVVYSDEINAEAAFLEKCMYARRSGLDVHCVSLLNQEGQVVARKCYKTEND